MHSIFKVIKTCRPIVNAGIVNAGIANTKISYKGVITRNSSTLPVGYAVETMSVEDLEKVMGWAREEGWNPGWQEHILFHAADSNGYRIACLNGKPVASLAAVQYPEKRAFLGLYIVSPQFRGQGYGKLLWDVSLKSVKQNDSIGLNGVLNQIEAYQSEGFRPSHMNTRWSAQLFGCHPKEKRRPLQFTQDSTLNEIAMLDYESTSIFRPNFWKQALMRPKSSFLVHKEGGRVNGFGMVSACVDGFKLGPIYASKQHVAEGIVDELWDYAKNNADLTTKKDATMQIDTTESNKHAEQFVKKFGFVRVFDTVRMYKGEKPDCNEALIYGLNSLEIG